MRWFMFHHFFVWIDQLPNMRPESINPRPACMSISKQLQNKIIYYLLVAATPLASSPKED